jgi:hypothetical protein
MTVAVNQIPECVGYALIAGVDPFHALQAAWIANIFTPLLGAAPGMVSGPSGLGAIAIRYLVSTHGPEYIFYSVICCGFCQVLFGALRLGKYLRLLPTGITIGMVNGMCLLLVALQLRYFKLYPAMEATDVDISSDQTSEAADSYVEPTRYLESTSFTDNIIEDTLNQPWAYFLGYDLPWDATGSQLIIMSVFFFYNCNRAFRINDAIHIDGRCPLPYSVCNIDANERRHQQSHDTIACEVACDDRS